MAYCIIEQSLVISLIIVFRQVYQCMLVILHETYRPLSIELFGCRFQTIRLQIYDVTS